VLLPSQGRIVQLAKDLGITIFAKSATRHKRTGNFIAYKPWTYRYVQRIPYTTTGMLNAYGLTNPGVVACAKEIRKSCEMGFNVIPNFYPEFSKGTVVAIAETLQAIEIYREILGSFFWALELNDSCPNSQEKITENTHQVLACSRAIREKYPWLFQIAKISIVHAYPFVEELVTVVDAIHSLNSIPYELVYNAKEWPSPLADAGGGGVSGGPAKEKALNYNAGLVKRVNTNIIFGCGVEDDEDIFTYADIGAVLKGFSVSLCSVVIRTPGDAKSTLKSVVPHYFSVR
jgi:dihydroorotate dehydrogenase (NAD+) catalytic subunit